MSAGLFGLLDDVAVLARLAAATGRATAKAERLMLKHDIDTKSLRGDNPTGIAICTDCGELATPMLFRFADPRF